MEKEVDATIRVKNITADKVRWLASLLGISIKDTAELVTGEYIEVNREKLDIKSQQFLGKVSTPSASQ
jgi:hypothetical protein